jgi:hypothetical protein
MKHFILVLILVSSSLLSLQAQEIARHALGIRFGDNDGFGGEISYQAELSERTRLEVDLGYRDHVKTDAFKLTGIYQWVFYVDNGFNWFAGVGGGVGSWSYKNKIDPVDEDGIFVNAVGNIGIEYDFKGPVLISLDFRPEVGVVGDYGKDTDLDLALAIRFQF